MENKLNCLNTEESLKVFAPVSELLEQLKPSFIQKPNELVVTESTKSVTGLKFDGSKPKISLIPAEAINEMAIAFTYGASKYAADNFKNGVAYRRLLDAALRHILAISNNEDEDSESGNTHIGHALASLAMLAYMMKNRPEFDDRYKGGGGPQNK